MAITAPINWPKILADLVAKGWSFPRIAAAIEAADSAPYWWRDGGEPRYAYGARLIELHTEVCGIQHFENNTAQSPARTRLDPTTTGASHAQIEIPQARTEKTRKQGA
jgi:hypothetical protein